MNVFKLKSDKIQITKPNTDNNSGSVKSAFTQLNFDTWIRLLLIWLFLTFAAMGLGWRLYQLQIVKGEELAKYAKQQQSYNFRPYIPRRSVMDVKGNVIALDKVVYKVYVHPIMLSESKEVVAEKLANILTDRDKNEILKVLNSGNTGIVLERTITEDQGNSIRRLGFEGIDLEKRYARFYPQGKLFADVIGYVDTEHNGQAGIEYSQQELLERDLSELNLKSMITVKRDGEGSIIPASLPDGIVQLDDLQLQLSLDLRLQRAARDSLKAQIQKFNAKRGAVIVMDVHTGEIVSLVSEPTYDPNNYSNYDFALYKNWTVTDSYEPGSTFKPINVAIALDEGVINSNSTVLDSPSTVIDGWPISNASKTGKGWVSITKAMEDSSNTAMIHTMKK